MIPATISESLKSLRLILISPTALSMQLGLFRIYYLGLGQDTSSIFPLSFPIITALAPQIRRTMQELVSTYISIRHSGNNEMTIP